MKAPTISSIITVVFLLSCNAIEQKQQEPAEQPSKPTPGVMRSETIALKETFQMDDTAVAGDRADRLKPIRENFKRINSIAKWSSVTTKELAESTEGGEALFYSSNGDLEKIATRRFGETYQQLTEYYLLNGTLSFVFEKSYKYNRPIYHDSATMKENKDDQAFDFKKSTPTESRSYFEKGKLIHRINTPDDHSPVTEAYLQEEQKRIMTDYDKLKTMTK